MLPRQHRLPLRFYRLQLESTGHRLQNHYFTLIYSTQTTNSTNLSRVAFLVSKKISSKATDRNHLRRRLAGVILSLLSSLKLGFDFIIIPHPSALKINSQETISNLKKILSQAQII